MSLWLTKDSENDKKRRAHMTAQEVFSGERYLYAPRHFIDIKILAVREKLDIMHQIMN